MLELRICGGVEVESNGHVVAESLIGGRQGRLALAYLVCERGRAVRRDELADLLWPEQLPESWTASLSAVISRLRRLFTEAGLDGASVVLSSPGAYQLDLPAGTRVDLEDLLAAVDEAEEAAAAGDTVSALAAATRADTVAERGFLADDCEWVDARRAAIRDLRVRASIAQSVAHVAAGASGRAIEAARRAVDLDGSKESAYRQLMLVLAAAGERAEALRVWDRCRITLVEELGVDPSPETEAIYLRLLETSAPAPVVTELPSGVVTFLLTDIVESSMLWEQHTAAMASALERHDAIVGAVVAAHGGTLLKSKLEGDATVSVFARATECAHAALALLEAIESEPWPEGASPRLRMAMHTGEAFERGGDYFGPALNRAARVRSIAGPNEVLLSQAVAELVRDHLPGGVVLRDRGLQSLRGLSRGENVFELTRVAAETDDPSAAAFAEELTRPPVPAALIGNGPFVGRGRELEQLRDLWDRTMAGETGAVFVGGEPGVGKSRLAGEISQRAHSAGGLVLYGRCDEDLAAPLQPFIEAVRALAPVLGAARLRTVRGVDELTRVVPELTEVLGEKPGVRADPDTERLALFDAVTQLLVVASSEAPVLLVLDDLHWAGKTTLSLLRHLLRGTKGNRLLVVGTYRDTELARTHPLAETLADLRRDTDPDRITLGGLGEADVAAYLTAIGNTDRALGHELAEVTAGNPFFLIEVVRHVEESGGSWQPGSLPEGVREATGRRLSRLSESANDALAVAAVVGITFDLALVEQVRGVELLDPIAEAVQAGLVLEEPGSLARFRFAHAIVRQVLLSELVSLKRVRLHRTIAELLESTPATGDLDARLADLAYHWFECAAAGGADKAVAACRRAADRALERLAYEEAGDLYAMALQALEWADDADTETAAALHLARCDALLTAGDVAGASAAIDALELAAVGSERLAAWYTTYAGLLAVLGEPDRLTEIVQSIGAAAGAMRDVGDLTGEAKARYVHAVALERLGQIGAAEPALDVALAAARSAGDRRLADAILAELPPAALWGPSPVTRASGRCLDVVRVLRITSGASAVEAVALRCQAVLEALRGRMDAARRLVSSSRRTVEQLGLTHRRLEAELAAGLIELLDGEAVAAEERLRAAYEGLRERGLGGEAALAGAFLGRALLLQGRVDEADEVAADAEALAGSDLKAAITWRVVRAEVASRRGDTERALALAREAVDLASATDALLLVADARLTLSGVLRVAGDIAAADAEARQAVEACESKGATVLAALARDAMGVPSAAAPPPEPPPVATFGNGPEPNLAMAYGLRFRDAFNRGDWDAVRADLSPVRKVDDRRPVVGMTVYGYLEELEGWDDPNHDIHAGGGRFEPPELVATRGDRIALCRWLLRGPGMEVPYLAISRVDADGRITDYVMYEPEALDDAIAALDAMVSATAFENDATRSLARFLAAHRAHDWNALVADAAEGWYIDDRRSVVGGVLDRDQSLATNRLIFDGGGGIESEIVATRGRSLALARSTLTIPDPEATETVLGITRTDDAGRSERVIMFDADDIDGALAEMDRMFLEGEGAEHADVLTIGSSILDGLARTDVAAVRGLIAPGFRYRDHRAVIASSADADEWLASFDVTSDLYGPGVQLVEHITNVSSTGGLWAVTFTGDLADGGQWESRLLLVLQIANRQLASLDLYADHDLDAARATLDARARPAVERFENDATRAAVLVDAAFRARDADALADLYADDWTMDDRRSVVGGLLLDAEQSMASTRWVFGGRGEFDTEQIATRGRALELTRWTLRIPDPEATETVLSVNRCNESARQEFSVIFDPDDLEGAFAELDRQFLEGEGAEHADVLALGASFLDGLNRLDAAAIRSLLASQFRARDHRAVVETDVMGADEWLAMLVHVSSELYGPGVTRVEHITNLSSSGGLWAVAFTGDLADGGPWEIRLLFALRVAGGRIAAVDFYDDHDLDAARAALAASTSPDAEWHENDATRSVARLHSAHAAHDWDAVAAEFADDVRMEDRRSLFRVTADHDQAVASMRVIFDGRGTLDWEVLATRGRSLSLQRSTIWLPTFEASDTVLAISRTNDAGRQDLQLFFDADDLDGAVAELDRLWREKDGAEADAKLDTQPIGNAAWRAALAHGDAYSRSDWQAFLNATDPDFVYVDHRHGIRLRFEGADALDALRDGFLLDEFRYQRVLLAARGDDLVLTRDLAWFVDGIAGPSEVENLMLVESGPDGRVRSNTTFDVDEVDVAYAALEARFAELEP